MTACGFHRCCKMDLFHRKNDVCYRVGSEVRDSNEIKSSLLGAYSVSCSELQLRWPWSVLGALTGVCAMGLEEAKGSRLQQPHIQ